VLAAILFVVAWNMSEARHFLDLSRHAPRHDVILLWLTFLLTVFADLVIAVNVGVLLAALLFMKRMSETVRIEGESEESLASVCPVGVPHDTMVYSIDGPLFFGAAATFESTLASLHDKTRVLVLRLGQVPLMDVTAMRALEDLTRHFQKRGGKVLLCEANTRVNEKLKNFGLLERLHQEDAMVSLLDVLSADSREAVPPG